MTWNRETQEYELIMEMSLTLALRISDGDDICHKYFAYRWNTLKREILKASEDTHEDAADIFHRFQKGVHARHEVLQEEVQSTPQAG